MRLPVLAWAAGLAVFELLWGGRFYDSTTHVGHDFAFTAVSLLEGRAWLESNGWIAGWAMTPWFTPAWCAGAAFHADPQSTFYSTVQLLAVRFDPFRATHLNALFSATVAFWGCWLFARKVLGWSNAAGTVFAVLGMVNALLPMRSAVGQASYQAFYLWVWLAMALCWPAVRRAAGRILWPSIGVAVCLTLWLQGGFAGMMVPVTLGVGALGLALVVGGRLELSTLLARAVAGGVLALAVNASKLYESASLMANFPRDLYDMPGFRSFPDALTATLMSLTLPSQWTTHFAMRNMGQVQWTVLPHEWAMHFGWGAVAAALAAAALVRLRTRGVEPPAPAATPPPPVASRSTSARVAALAGLVALLALPLMLLWEFQPLREIIKSIPVLSSTTWPMRWIVIYLPLAQWLLAAPVARLLELSPTRLRSALTAGFIALAWAGPVTEPLEYYSDPVWQHYDPRAARDAFAASEARGSPPISRIERSADGSLDSSGNDSMFRGGSQARCYNPIYGYRLEDFPQPERLRAGSALARDDAGRSMISNPACLVHPLENACAPGDGFRLDDPRQRLAAERFIARKPFAWQRPPLGTALAWTSAVSSSLLLAVVVAGALLALRRRLRQRASGSRPRR